MDVPLCAEAACACVRCLYGPRLQTLVSIRVEWKRLISATLFQWVPSHAITVTQKSETSKLKVRIPGAGGVGQWLKALVSLVEGLRFGSQNPQSSSQPFVSPVQRIQGPLLALMGIRHAYDIQINMQAEHPST